MGLVVSDAHGRPLLADVRIGSPVDLAGGDE
jgi:hypothetical protein